MKKKTCIFLSAVLFLLGSAGCAEKKEIVYGEEEMARPLWISDTMYNESVLLVKEKDLSEATGTLAFEPKGKVKITDCTMTRTFEEGKDYTISGRTVTVTSGTSMPWINEEILYGIDMPEGKGLSVQPASEAGRSKGYESVLYTEGRFLIENQILVTYEYDKAQWNEGVKPLYQGDKLPNTLAKLKNKEAVNIVAYGDSISTGCNSTGGGLQSVYDDTYPGNSVYIPFDMPPYTPTFPELFASGLARAYGAETTVLGAAMGGQTSDWGARNAAARVVNPDMGYEPDLVTVTFGMNDATLGVPLDRFEENMLKIIDDVRAASEKEVEFILIGTMLANPDAVQCADQEAYWPVLEKIAAQREGVAAVNIGSIHAYLLQNKRYQDMIANNINHPNDFLIRIYAMSLLSALIEY